MREERNKWRGRVQSSTDARLEDMTGKVYGKLTVVRRDGFRLDNRKNGRLRQLWLCKCECGNETHTYSRTLKNSRPTISCGCNRSSIAQANVIKWPARENKCVICGATFKYKCPKNKEKMLCSKACWRIYKNTYAKLLSKKDFPHAFKALLRNALRSTKNEGSKFEIDLNWISDKFATQEGRCARSHLPFELGIKNPWSPSLDQIVPSAGYTKENTQLVCLIYNYCKHTWSEQVVLKFAEALVKQHSNSTTAFTQDGIPQFPVGVGFRCSEDL